MPDEGDSGSYAGFLPPRPAGPEPDLGPKPGPEPAEAQAPPAAPLHRGYAPPAAHEAQAAPAYPSAQQQLGWGAPIAGDQPGAAQAGTHHSGPGTYRPGQPVAPDNGAAIAGLSLSITAAALLLLSVGTSTIISIACAGLGIHYSRKGRERVDRGETTKHRGVAQAGFVTGLVALAFSILCTLVWLLFVIVWATNDEFRQEIKDELDDGDSDPPRGLEASLRVAALAVRVVAALT